MQSYFDNILSKYQCGFLKSYHSQHWLITMVEKWCGNVNEGGALGALLSDLPKADFRLLSLIHMVLIRNRYISYTITCPIERKC